jgi:hypothetical protein
MYDPEGKPKEYSQLAAIQMGWYFRNGVVNWRAAQVAANERDKGCFDVDLSRWNDVTTELEARVLRIKAGGDRKDAETLKAEFVDARDDWATARGVIRERYLRAPKASFVYTIRY